MTTVNLYVTCAAGGAAAAVALTPLAIFAGGRLGLMDEPGVRKVHKRAVPRIGGVAITAALLAGLAALGAISHDTALPLAQWVTLLGATAFVFAVGLMDDVRTVSPRFKLLAIVAAALAVTGSGLRFDGFYLNASGVLGIDGLSWIVTPLWVLAVTSSIAFIDGIDGLAASIVLAAAGTLAVVLGGAGQVQLAAVALLLAGVLAGFLVFNRHPARVFMGDGGSLTIGFLVAVLCVAANPRVGTMRGMVIPTLALAVPLLDMALTLFRRHIQQRRSIFSSEAGHVHHRLMERGLSQRQALRIIVLATAAAIAIGFVADLTPGWGTVGVLALAAPVLYGLFRFAGSVRTSEMLAAVRRKRHIDRRRSRYESAFEDMQLRFREVRTFGQWWQEVCSAATALELARVEAAVTCRDGSTRTLQWTPVDDVDPRVQRIAATIPIRQRRGDECIQAQVQVAATDSLESAGHRVALFTRLMSEHALADLADGTGAAADRSRRRASLSRIAGLVHSNSNSETDAHSNGHTNGRGNGHHPAAPPRVAVVHDFLYTYCGAERVLEHIIDLFPHCDLFSLFDFVPDEERSFLRGKTPRTSIIQKLPLAAKKHRAYLPLMPFAIEQLDLSGYDLVISSSYLAAKGVLTGPDQLHVCYCHSPVRYAWDLQHQYLDRQGLRFGPKALFARAVLHYLRNWDARTALGVDVFLANSQFIARRIEKTYRRRAQTIYPPVDLDRFDVQTQKEGYYLTASRLVPYKRIDLVIEAFNRMPERQLIVAGGGPDLNDLQDIAGPNVKLLGHVPEPQFRHVMQQARAFVFAAEEDFGLVPVEAMACGTPVLAYGRGGVTETVQHGRTGLFFPFQHPESIMAAVRDFERLDTPLDPQAIRARAAEFSVARFRHEFAAAIDSAWSTFAQARTERTGGITDTAFDIDRTQAIVVTDPQPHHQATHSNGNGHGTARDAIAPLLQPHTHSGGNGHSPDPSHNHHPAAAAAVPAVD